MFERTSQSLERPRPRNLRTLPVAIAFHLGVIGALALGSILLVEAIPDDMLPRIPGILVVHVVAPAPLGTEDGGGGPAPQPLAPVAPPPEIRPEMVQPLAVEDLVPVAPDPPDTGDRPGPFDAAPGDGPGTGPGPYGRPDGVEGGRGPVIPGLPAREAPPADAGPIEVRGSVRPPRLLVKVEPVYPPLAIKARVQGVVRLRAVIGPGGSVEDLSVVSSASPLLVDAARDAVRRWVYAPALQEGRPVRVWFEAVVAFEID